MADLRFRYRHVHATLFKFIRAQLVAVGWGDASLPLTNPANTAVNFGTTPTTFIDFQPDEAGVTVAVNTVAVTLGDEPASQDQELGGGLRQLPIPLFVDIFGANQAISQSIASDVKDMLEDVYLFVMDHTAVPSVATDEQVELDKDDLMVEKPQAALAATDFKRHWRVVKTLARINYGGGAE